MPRFTLMEEFHLGIYVPLGLTDPEYEAIREALNDPRFVARIRQAIRDIFRSNPNLVQTRRRLSR